MPKSFLYARFRVHSILCSAPPTRIEGCPRAQRPGSQRKLPVRGINTRDFLEEGERRTVGAQSANLLDGGPFIEGGVVLSSKPFWSTLGSLRTQCRKCAHPMLPMRLPVLLQNAATSCCIAAWYLRTFAFRNAAADFSSPPLKIACRIPRSSRFGLPELR